MKIIKIIPSKTFGGSWRAEEAPGIAPCVVGPNGRQTDYLVPLSCAKDPSTGVPGHDHLPRASRTACLMP